MKNRLKGSKSLTVSDSKTRMRHIYFVHLSSYLCFNLQNLDQDGESAE